MQPIFKQEFTLTHLHTDRFDRAKLSVILHFIQEAAGTHSQLLAVGGDTLAGKHLFWAATRTRLQITRLPRLDETITVETWPMPTTRVAYPRSVIAYDAAGNELFRAITLWVLMDETTRAMVLPGRSGITVDGTLTGNELAVPHAIAARPMVNQVTRRVGYTLLDRNGHMNNTRYADWLDDLLPAAFHGAHPAQELTLCYMSEALEGEEIALHYELTDGPTLTVDATRQTGNGSERVFSAQVCYNNIL